MIESQTIKEVKEQIKILEVVSDYVVLRRNGKEYTGKCPFHEDDKPSFNVNTEKGLYHCFGCGAGGDSIRFIQQKNNSNFVDAIIELAKKYNIEIKLTDPVKQAEYKTKQAESNIFYEILELSTKFYHRQLLSNYRLLKPFFDDRGITENSINDFKLGYANNNRVELYQYLLERIPEYQDYFIRSGVVSKKDNAPDVAINDFFRDRIIIPIRDYQGRVIGFGGRRLSEDNNIPKYINSPQSEIFDKSNIIFGFNVAAKTIRTVRPLNYLILTEGYFDVISLHQIGFKNTVAVLGTAINQSQLKKVFKASNNLIISFDSDDAGKDATRKIINGLNYEIKNDLIEVRVLDLPTKDPSDFIKDKSQTAYSDLLNIINNSKNWIDWQVNNILNEKDLNNERNWKQVFNSLLNLSLSVSELDRIKYIQQFSELLAGNHPVTEGEIYKMFINKLKKKSYNNIKNISTIKNDNYESGISLTAKSEEMILKLYLHLPELRQAIRYQFIYRDIYFCIEKNRNLWGDICEVEPESISIEEVDIFTPRNDLINKLKVKYKDLVYPEYFHLSERESDAIKQGYPNMMTLALNHLERKILEKKIAESWAMWKSENNDNYLKIYQEYYGRIQTLDTK